MALQGSGEIISGGLGGGFQERFRGQGEFRFQVPPSYGAEPLEGTTAAGEFSCL